MKKWMYVLVSLMMLLSAVSVFAEETPAPLTLTEIGMFSAGGTVTEPVEGDYDPTTNWMDANLQTSYGIPVPPFRSDDWPL